MIELNKSRLLNKKETILNVSKAIDFASDLPSAAFHISNLEVAVNNLHLHANISFRRKR